MKSSSEDLRQAMQARTDEELYILLHVHSQDYTPEAIKAASEEFSRRQLDEPTIRHIAGVAKKGLEDGDGKLGRPEGKPTNDAKETAAGWSWRDSDLKGTARGLGRLVLLCFAGYLIYGGYGLLDSIGWIAHSHDTPVWISGNWMVGEYRDCGMLTTTPHPGVTLSPQVRAELPRLFCDERGNNDLPNGFLREFFNNPQGFADATNAVFHGGDWSEFNNKFHVLPVVYYGRLDRPDAVVVSWRCQRKSESLECKALN